MYRLPAWGGASRGDARREKAASRWRRAARLELRPRARRRAVPGRAGPSAAQPEEAVPGGRRAGGSATARSSTATAPRLRAGPRRRCPCARACRASAQVTLDWLRRARPDAAGRRRGRWLEFAFPPARRTVAPCGRSDARHLPSSFTSTAAPRWARRSASATSRRRVAKWARAGHQMVVVPSAMSGETNRLLGLAQAARPAQTTSDACCASST